MMRCCMVIAVALTSCSKPKGAIDGATLDAINALVPEPLRSRVRFEARTVEEPGKHGLRYALPVPKGWRTDGNMTVTSSCASTATSIPEAGGAAVPCASQSWEPLIDKKIQTDFLDVIDVVKGPNRRTVFSKGGLMNPDSRAISVFWWQPNGVEYFWCHVTLEPALIDAAKAFAKACESVVVTNL